MKNISIQGPYYMKVIDITQSKMLYCPNMIFFDNSRNHIVHKMVFLVKIRKGYFKINIRINLGDLKFIVRLNICII